MTTGSGTDAQIGFAVETTAGTRVTPTRFPELVSEAIKIDRQTIRSAGIRAGRRYGARMQNGASLWAGSTTLILAPQGLGMLLRAAFGTVSTTGAGPYTHTFTPGPTSDDTLTMQIGRPRVGSTTVDPTDYYGAACNGFSFSAASADTEEIPITFDWVGMGYSTAQSLASASFPTGYTGFRWLDGSISVGGSDKACKSISITHANNLNAGRLRISATTPGTPLQATEGGLRSTTGTLMCDYTATTLRDAYFSGADLAVSLALASGSTSLTIAGNVRPNDNAEPNVAGPDNLEHAFGFEFYSSTSDAAAITVTLINADSTP